MILTTTPTIEGHPIREYKGLVTGETIIGANFVKDFFAGIRDIVGGRSGSYESVLREAKDTALREMQERAQMNAFVNYLIISVQLKNNVECRVLAELAYIEAIARLLLPTSQTSSTILSLILHAAVTPMTCGCHNLTVSNT